MTKQERHQKCKTKRREQAKRKAKAYKRLVLACRRQWDRARRAQERRERREHTRRIMREFRFRVKVVNYFQQLRALDVPEKRAIELVLERYRPREEGDLRLSASTIRS